MVQPNDSNRLDSLARREQRHRHLKDSHVNMFRHVSKHFTFGLHSRAHFYITVLIILKIILKCVPICISNVFFHFPLKKKKNILGFVQPLILVWVCGGSSLSTKAQLLFLSTSTSSSGGKLWDSPSGSSVCPGSSAG